MIIITVTLLKFLTQLVGFYSLLKHNKQISIFIFLLLFLQLDPLIVIERRAVRLFIILLTTWSSVDFYPVPGDLRSGN